MSQLRIRRVSSQHRKVFSLSCLREKIVCKEPFVGAIFAVMEELAIVHVDTSAYAQATVLHYEDHNVSLTIGSEVEIPVQKSDENPPMFEDTYILEEDPSPVWPGGPPPWWENDYAGDIYENLKKSENEFPDIGFESPNLYDRPNLVNYISHVADTLGMTNATKFLAVRLLDGYMDKHSVIPSRLKIMALACLSISCEHR